MSFVASLFGAGKAKDATVKNQDKALAEQKRQYDLSRADQLPWLQAGSGALTDMQALNKGDFTKFYSSPDYLYALSEGIKGLDRSSAAKGRLYSGGYGEDLTKFGQGLATQYYNNFYGKLSSMAGQGQSTGNALGALGKNYADAYAQGRTNIGNVRASYYNARGNAWGTGLDQLGGFIGGGGFG